MMGGLARLAATLTLILFCGLAGRGDSAYAAPHSSFGAASEQSVAQAGDAAQSPSSAFRRPAAGGRVARDTAAEQSLWGRWQRWITDVQRDFSQRMTAAVRKLKEGDPLRALVSLALISFLYGIAHAVGPGHGKAVITSYMFANERTLKRGIALAVASSFMQAVTAVVAITVLAVLLNMTGLKIQAYADYLEAASYVLVVFVGLWLVWNQIRKLLAALRTTPATAAVVEPQHHHDHAHHHGHDHAHDHTHGPGCGCGHNHIPAPEALTDDKWNWREAASIILAIGLRPCSGAIIVLVFAYVNGLYWAGIASTFAMAVGTAITISALAVLAVGSKQLALQIYGEDSRGSSLLVNGIALAGGLIVTILGITLFLGALGPARPFG